MNKYKDNISNGEQDHFEEFLKEFKEFEKKLQVKKLRDIFLDAYSAWLKDNSRANKLKVLHCALKLTAVDDSFKISCLFNKKAA